MTTERKEMRSPGVAFFVCKYSLEKARVDLARRRSTRGDLTLLRREGRKLLLLRRESILETLGVSRIQVI
ncbi:hypothetical protein E1A91_D09G064400v1 [Gossypium mustelinum]|uniref:Uncharacterized protein n=1 Tax=Gossypium mustelinum TaxID=34275 RepID=A0A5D2TG37_GOSMU|nr:hypothetical protein E1A91_D09G064400v1 [Gossypium mustelinum]